MQRAIDIPKIRPQRRHVLVAGPAPVVTEKEIHEGQ